MLHSTKGFLIVVFTFFVSVSIKAQIISGTISNVEGERLPFANAYAEEFAQGTSADENGNYSLELKPGSYTLLFSMVGYETIKKMIEVKENDILRFDITLPRANDLEQIEVYADKKDKAKEIMEQVRAQRRKHLKSIVDYSCETYLKISLEKDVMDTLERKDSVETEKIDTLIGLKRKSLDVIESNSTSYFKSPGKFSEQIHGYSNYNQKHQEAKFDAGAVRSASIELDVGRESIAVAPSKNEISITNPYVLYKDVFSSDLNFYKNTIDFPAITQRPLLSPIASGGDMNYTYEYEGSHMGKGKIVHNVRVTPLFKHEALFTGTIQIEDGTWALLALDLTINKSALNFCNMFRIRQKYQEVDTGKYLPVTRDIYYIIKEKKDTIFGNVVIQHSNYKVNTNLNAELFGNEIKKFDPEALDRDTSYWESSRPIVLNKHEKELVHNSDSLFNYYTSDAFYRESDSLFNKIGWWSFFNGIGHRNRSKGREWYISGVFEQIVPFGIGGYRHKLPGYIKKTFKNDYSLKFKGYVDYGFKNSDVRGLVETSFLYGPKKFVETSIRYGNYYDLINSYASVAQTFSRSNYVRTVTYGFSQRMEFINGLFAKFSFDYSDQNPLTNVQLSRWSGKIFGDLNSPVDFDRYIKSEAKLQMTYVIKQKFAIVRNKKIIYGSDYPELNLTYRKGIPGLFNSEVNFDYVELEAKGTVQLKRFGTSEWVGGMGTFFNKSDLRLLEHKYFRGSDPFFFSNPLYSLQLLGPTLHTPNEFFKANYFHHFDGILIGKIPLLNRLKLSVAAGGGALAIPDSDFAHVEAFAGIEKVLRIKDNLFKIGVFGVKGYNTLYNDPISIKFGISFFNSFSNTWDY